MKYLKMKKSIQNVVCTQDQVMIYNACLKNDIAASLGSQEYCVNSELEVITFHGYTKLGEKTCRKYRTMAINLIKKLHSIGLYVKDPVLLNHFGTEYDRLVFVRPDFLDWLPGDEITRQDYIHSNLWTTENIFGAQLMWVEMDARTHCIWSSMAAIDVAPKIYEFDTYMGRRKKDGNDVHIYRVKVYDYSRKIVKNRMQDLQFSALHLVSKMHSKDVYHGNLSRETIVTNDKYENVRIVGWQDARWIDSDMSQEEKKQLLDKNIEEVNAIFASISRDSPTSSSSSKSLSSFASNPVYVRYDPGKSKEE